MRLLSLAGGARARLLALAFGLAVGALTLSASGVGQRPPASPPRELSRTDEERERELRAKAVAFGRLGKYEEAQGPVREILELRTRTLGENHFATADTRREIETLKQLAALPEADRVEYRKTYVLFDEMAELWRKAQYADALRPAEQILDIYRLLLGPEHISVAVAANWYGQLLNLAARYPDAEKQFREALRIVLQVVGEDSPGTAALYGNLALSLQKQGKYREARRLFEDDLKITIRLRGNEHPDTAVVYNNLAGNLERGEARFRDAESLHRKAEKILRAAGAEESNRLATTCNNLALNLQNQGRYDEAVPLYQEALEIRHKVLGADHPATGEVSMNFATCQEAQGNIVAAETLYRETLGTYRKAYGPDHPNTAWALNNLGVNLDKQWKQAEAEERLREALAIMLRAPADQGEAVAVMSNNLASCLRGREKYEEAYEHCTKALAVLRDRLGPDHPVVAVALNNVAAGLDDQEKYPEAERHLREALAILKRCHGDGHPETAEARDNLAVNLYHQGQFDEAERLFKEALAAQRRVLGESHPSTALTYKLLVLNCCARGDHAQAVALAEDAAKSFEAARRRIGYAGLDRARRTAESSPYPALAAAAARGGKPGDAWHALEQNLARGLLDDLSARPLSADERGREQELLGRLDLLDRQVAALPADGGTDAERKAAGELRRQRDAAQAEFVRFQADLASRYGVPAGEVYDLAHIQARLREDTALLAWVDLSDQDRRADPKGDHWACLVRHRGAPVWVRLSGTGPDGAWNDEDDRLPARARVAFGNRPADRAGQWNDLARRLARQRLVPLEEHLQGGAEFPPVRHLIVLPSHQMRRIPAEALTDKLTVSYAPSGTMFAWLREHRPAAGGEVPAASLLAFGDPEFQPAGGAEASSPKAVGPESGGRPESFAPLPGTRQELMGLARVFSSPQLFMGPAASERSLDRLAASGDLRTFPYLHFATHGVLDDQRPMRSALILAQDRPHDSLSAALKGQAPHEGRLTAERILRGWKLDAELVTLSACQSGLGKYAGGEGYLGFSQALFLAGARSMVVSLWQVDDTATALLMTRFYENLLGTPEKTVKPLPKAEALAEAKRWLRGLRPDEVEQLTRDLPTRGTRGRLEPRKTPEGPSPVRSYEHPYFWSGFILIGDPG
jgi:CHAT domain-containing protein/tetratricopeptide (TPR) repeat protein